MRIESNLKRSPRSIVKLSSADDMLMNRVNEKLLFTSTKQQNKHFSYDLRGQVASELFTFEPSLNQNQDPESAAKQKRCINFG